MRPVLAAALPHFGEEPPLTGERGAGTIFFAGCNLRCVYCQNHQISHGRLGEPVSSEDLAEIMLDLERKGCATLEPVSPSHHLPGLLEALAIARDRGLNLPLVYNTNAYESPEILNLLGGIVDVYLPDLKYASNYFSREYSAVSDYVEISRAAVKAMHAQVGNLVLDLHGHAVRGLIIRHLVLPENVAGTDETLRWIKENLPETVTLSLMAQYSPLHEAKQFSRLDRRITRREYDGIVDLAWEMGFENAFVQEFTSQDVGIPDFELNKPFCWD
jgi:putative pyruvate formate lyase activating enzyme